MSPTAETPIALKIFGGSVVGFVATLAILVKGNPEGLPYAPAAERLTAAAGVTTSEIGSRTQSPGPEVGVRAGAKPGPAGQAAHAAGGSTAPTSTFETPTGASWGSARPADATSAAPSSPVRLYAWSTASVDSGVVTLHWHPCHWNARIKPSNLETRRMTWNEAKGRFPPGVTVRPCSRCGELESREQGR